jgi:cytochrome c oxidase assembly protein subunit 15
MIGGIFYEHGHRMIASFVGLLTVVLALWLWRAEPRRWVRNLGWAALLAVITQGVLGGLTVLYLLPTPVSVGHACLAQLFFCMTVSLALFTSPYWQRMQARPPEAVDRGTPSLRHLSLAAALAVFTQLLMGAAFRHKGIGIIPHLLGAAVVALLVAWIVVRVMRRHPGEPGLAACVLALNGLLLVQLILGAAAYWIRDVTRFAPQPLPEMVLLTVAHVALGAVLLAVSVILAIQARTRLVPARQALERDRAGERIATTA